MTSTPSTATWSKEQLLGAAAQVESALLYDEKGRSLLFVDPIEEVCCWPSPKEEEDRPLWAGHITYEGQMCFRRYRSTLLFDPIRGEATVWGELPTTARPKAEAWRGTPLASESKESYLAKIEEIRELIRAGDVYQVCLSYERRFAGGGSPYCLFLELIERYKSPFSAYLDFGDRQLLSLSPERFLCYRQGELESRPIKGTGLDPDRLLASEKERAELAMITDLVRNDLAHISAVGSVEVTDERVLERHTGLYHTLSVVRSRPIVRPEEMVRAAFPPGSVTGCPKIAAMEVIERLEQRSRGAFTGAIGYICANGEFDLSVGIRVIEISDKEARCQMGGAIVVDSDPEEEWLEVQRKGRALVETLS